MAAYVFTKYEIPIFDATGAVIILNSVCQPVDLIKNVVTITTANGLPNYWVSTPRAISQPSMPLQVYALVNFITYQAVRTHQALTMILKFTCTPDRINRKIINYETMEVEALYKISRSLIYSYSEVNFSQTIKGLLLFV